MTTRSSSSSKNTPNGFATIAMILAVIGGMAAIFSPMSARLESLETKVSYLDSRLTEKTEQHSGRDERINSLDKLLMLLWDKVEKHNNILELKERDK